MNPEFSTFAQIILAISVGMVILNLALVRKRGPRAYVMAAAFLCLGAGSYFLWVGAPAWLRLTCWVLLAVLLFLDASIKAGQRPRPGA